MNRFEQALWNRAAAVLGPDAASRLILCERRADEASSDNEARRWIDEAYEIRGRMEAAEAPQAPAPVAQTQDRAPVARRDVPGTIGAKRAGDLHRVVREAAKARGVTEYMFAQLAIGEATGRTRPVCTFTDFTPDEARIVREAVRAAEVLVYA